MLSLEDRDYKAQKGNPMKAYVMTTGAVFGLITLAHLVRMVMEGSHVARDPIYILLTLVTAGLCLWAWRVLTLLRRA